MCVRVLARVWAYVRACVGDACGCVCVWIRVLCVFVWMLVLARVYACVVACEGA